MKVKAGTHQDREKEGTTKKCQPNEKQACSCPRAPRESSGLEASDLALEARVRYRTDILLKREPGGSLPCSMPPGDHTPAKGDTGES